MSNIQTTVPYTFKDPDLWAEKRHELDKKFSHHVAMKFSNEVDMRYARTWCYRRLGYDQLGQRWDWVESFIPPNDYVLGCWFESLEDANLFKLSCSE